MCVLYDGITVGSTESISGEAGTRTCNPWFTRHSAYQLTWRLQGIGYRRHHSAVVLVLKLLRRRGNGLLAHPTDWEKQGIEPAIPGLQDKTFCSFFHG